MTSEDAERLWKQLIRIADALDRLAPPPEPETQEPTSCPHPPEARISFGMTNGVEDWQCAICQYRTVAS